MQRPKVLITHYDVPKVEVMSLLGEICELIINEEQPYPTEEEIIAKVKGVDAIFWVSKLTLNKAIIDAAGPQMKIVGTMSAGVNNIDVEYLKLRGIKLGNTPEVVNDSTANTAVMLALTASKRMIEARNAIVDGTWTFGAQWLLGQDITNSKIGIVGLGGIGQTIVKRLKAFDIQSIMYTGRKEKEEGKKLEATFVSFDTLLRESDFIFPCVPLTHETKGMFNLEAFKKMKKTSVFVNISRGDVVVQEDLIKALKEKMIFAAGLDVMTPEPLPTNHELLSLPNCILAPHIGTATDVARNAMATLCAQNILRAIGGEEMITPVY